MKQIIYLDTDIVNSIIAQSEKGLTTEFSKEELDTDSETNKNEANTKVKSDVGLSFLKLVGAKIETSVAGSIGSEVEKTKSYREIMTKTLHDFALDHAKSIIVDRLEKEPEEIGSYIEITKIFDFVDLEYLEGLFSEGSLFEYVKRETEKNIQLEAEASKSDLNRDQKRKMDNKFKDEIKKKVINISKEYDGIKDGIKLLSKIIPYKRMLVSSDGLLIPLEDKYSRVDLSTMGFKYGGEITCIGMTTNIIGEDTDPLDVDNIFATLQFSISEVLRTLLPTKEKNLWIIHPIALYYGD